MYLTDQKIFYNKLQPTENLEKKQNREKSGLVNPFQRASVLLVNSVDNAIYKLFFLI